MPFKKDEDEQAYQALYYRDHREHIRATRAAWYIKHQKRLAAHHAAYRLANPELHYNGKKNYAHRKRANGGSFPHASWEHLKTLFGQCCAYCRQRIEKLTQDHVIPLSKGGRHFSGNIVPACQPCNSRKGTRI